VCNFWKNLYNLRRVDGSAPEPTLASGSWGLCPKTAKGYYLEKTLKTAEALEAPPQTSLASGGWGSVQDSEFLFSYIIATSKSERFVDDTQKYFVCRDTL